MAAGQRSCGNSAGAKSNIGLTALMCAAYKGHTAAAALLLDRGADAGAKNNASVTALMLAALSGHTASKSSLVLGLHDNNITGAWST